MASTPTTAHLVPNSQREPYRLQTPMPFPAHWDRRGLELLLRAN
jgi:hypothetical protein